MCVYVSVFFGYWYSIVLHHTFCLGNCIHCASLLFFIWTSHIETSMRLNGCWCLGIHTHINEELRIIFPQCFTCTSRKEVAKQKGYSRPWYKQHVCLTTVQWPYDGATLAVFRQPSVGAGSCTSYTRNQNTCPFSWFVHLSASDLVTRINLVTLWLWTHRLAGTSNGAILWRSENACSCNYMHCKISNNGYSILSMPLYIRCCPLNWPLVSFALFNFHSLLLAQFLDMLQV